MYVVYCVKLRCFRYYEWYIKIEIKDIVVCKCLLNRKELFIFVDLVVLIEIDEDDKLLLLFVFLIEREVLVDEKVKI